MGRRQDLQTLLEAICPNVYFQPPSNVQMNYPCIVYKRESATTRFASDMPYIITMRYLVTVIDRNPDSEIPDQVAMLPQCLMARYYAVNGLHHDVFNLYF